MSKQVAEQIFEQIRWYDSSALMAYGARQFAVLDELRGGLQMRVNGIRHKGLVKIVCNGSDLYDVTCFKIYKGEAKENGKITDLYFDQLVPALDCLIEGKDLDGWFGMEGINAKGI